MSLSFSRYVRFIFHACPVFFVASHFPTSAVVLIGCLVLCFPFIPPALPLFSFLSLSGPFQVPFSFPFHFPLLSCHVDFLFPPLISLHFPTYQTSGRGGGVILYPLLGFRHAEQCRRISSTKTRSPVLLGKNLSCHFVRRAGNFQLLNWIHAFRWFCGRCSINVSNFFLTLCSN